MVGQPLALRLGRRAEQPEHQEEGHHRGDEVGIGDLPRPAVMAFRFLDDHFLDDDRPAFGRGVVRRFGSRFGRRGAEPLARRLATLLALQMVEQLDQPGGAPARGRPERALSTASAMRIGRFSEAISTCLTEW